MSEVVIRVHGDTDAELHEQIDAARARGKLVQIDMRRNVRRMYSVLSDRTSFYGEGGSATVIVDVDGDVPPLSPSDRLLVDMVRKRALTSMHAEAVSEIARRLESNGDEQAAQVMRQLAKQAGVV